jgi:dTDP-4-dehydrorhamnose 3,5-epimerase
MIFQETTLKGAFLLDWQPHEDERGAFARTFCAREFEAHRLPTQFVQCSVSVNKRRGTLRGMHWQAAPHEEGKLIRCTRGAIYDVIVDLRPESPTYRASYATELNELNHRQLFVPPGFAHGFQTLQDNTEVYYQMTAFHAPDSARGARWNDPAFAIRWPDANPRILNERDASFADFAS